MKKILTLVTFVVISLISLHTQAQAFGTGDILLNLGIGFGEMYHFPSGSNNPFSNSNNGLYGYNFQRTIPTGQFSFQAEFAVHKYVGVGFVVGIGGRAEATPGPVVYGVGYNFGGIYAKEVNIPIGVLANFHFFQLIADKTGKNIHADKLDVYAGITAGSGVAIHPYGSNDVNYQNTFYDALFFFGPHAGVNYYFTNNIAVNGEVGWGVTVIQAGITFKLGGSKGSAKSK